MYFFLLATFKIGQIETFYSRMNIGIYRFKPLNVMYTPVPLMDWVVNH